MFNEAIKTLADVMHILLKRSLISLSTFDSMGYMYTGECLVLKARIGALVVMKGHKNSAQLYIL